ncbi:peptidoglycan-binding domain-containing protein [Microbispora sp. ATCC PTA-5024]|uniref:peptidoglycan-binding domain-containing protein n=1 Tax=Microbispora sp. ATCC PTA-5024 TaxID=316330 RepID=UPI000411168C|nr:peptidoglycan-binding domain-containing protein [Microbispora sp. ATCC PTA-5024]
MRRLLAVTLVLTACTPTQAATPPFPTTPVVRTDLVSRTSVDGTLGYAGRETVTGGPGIVTWLPPDGGVIRRGRRVYAADGHAVPLIYGRTPLWRTLSVGARGRDVRVVERNLAALGYPLVVDDRFTWATAQAVKAWQRRLGRPRTGTLTPSDVVVQPGPIRVASRTGRLGGPASGPLLTVTGLKRQVVADIPVDRQQLAVRGGKVTITLPGGKTTTGHVTAIGTVAKAATTGQPGQGTETATIAVTITLDHPAAAGRLVAAPVTAGFAGAAHKRVLAVPVEALLGQADGTFAVEVAGRLVPVELGLFAGGLVEVTGVAEGTRVQVPRP